MANALSFLLQSNVKNFASISYIVSSTFQILEDIGNEFHSIHLKRFNSSAEIIEKIEPYEKRSIVSYGIHTKQSRQDYTDTHKEFHDAFDLTNLPVLNSFVKLDPQGLPRVNRIHNIR